MLAESGKALQRLNVVIYRLTALQLEDYPKFESC